MSGLKALIAQKSALEQICERKKWIWKETMKEHYELEKIDAKLIASGHYDRVIQ